MSNENCSELEGVYREGEPAFLQALQFPLCLLTCFSTACRESAMAFLFFSSSLNSLTLSLSPRPWSTKALGEGPSAALCFLGFTGFFNLTLTRWGGAAAEAPAAAAAARRSAFVCFVVAGFVILLSHYLCGRADTTASRVTRNPCMQLSMPC